MNRRQKIIVSVTGIFLVLLILVGLTYAYFLTRIDGNEAEKSISVTTADLAVKYSENDPTIVSKTLIKPDTVIGTKEFVVTNTGNATTNYSIVIDEVENNFERTEDLEYVLTNETDEVIATGTIKRMEAQIILSNISIEVGEENKHTYNFTVKYKEANTDQSVDMDKSLSLRLNIRRVSEWETAPEGTLLAAIKRDNEVVDAISAPGKAPSGVKYVDYSMDMLATYAVIEDNKYYTYATEYKFDKESGAYTLINPITTLGSEITENIIRNIYFYSVYGTETLEERENNDYSGLKNIYKLTDTIGGKTYDYDLYSASTVEIDEAVLSSTEDDYGTSYYYRGSIENNYVTFSNMCWRIVRVQGDGTIKLVLADENYPCSADVEANEDGTYSGYSTQNQKSGYISNQKYTYSDATDGTGIYYEKGNIPGALENWMVRENYVIDTTKLATTEWCNETSISKKIYYDEDNNVIDESNSDLIADTDHVYLAKERLFNTFNAKPTLRCNNVGIDGSKSTKVTSNIGILTADELVFAGSRYKDGTDIKNNTYLKTNSYGTTWTITPSIDYLTSGSDEVLSHVFDFSASRGGVRMDFEQSIDTASYIRPSIVLKNTVQVTTLNNGEPGTQSNPYVIN